MDDIEFADACPSGTSIGELILHEACGQGGEGLVYRATWRGRSVLAKEYRPTNLASRVMSAGQAEVRASRQSWQDQYRQALDRFIYLGERLRSLPPHQNIVRVHDVVKGMGTAFLVMDEVQGPSLGALLDHVGRCDPAQAFHLADQLSQALAFLERAQMVHRDIAPDNIIVSDVDQWSIVLIDFNAAKDMSARVSHSVAGLVKAGYSAIEQYDTAGDTPGVATDIYSTAAVLYRAIVGKPPLDAGRRIYRDEHRTLSALSPAGYDPAFLAAIDHGLEVRPESRPQSAAAWREELGLVYRKTGAGASGGVKDPPRAEVKARPKPPPPAPDAVPRSGQEHGQVPLRRFQFPLGIIIIVAAVLVAIAWSVASAPDIMALERLQKRAEAAAARGDAAEARTLYDQVLARDPKHHEAFLGKILLLLRAKDAKLHKEAIDMLRAGWLSDEERVLVDPYLTPEDRLALAGPDRYGDIESQPAMADPSNGADGATDGAATQSSEQEGQAVDRINDKYGTMPEPEPAARP